MTITNISARKVSLSIGGMDFSPCLISFQGSDSHLDQSGLISFTGTIVLGNAISSSESLDDRKNPTRFCRGVAVTLKIADSTGALRSHPRGSLRILSPKYDIEKQQLTLEVGDLIALLKFKEPTNSVEFDSFLVGEISSSGDGSTDYKDPILDYIAGSNKQLSEIISTLLSRAGINRFSGAIPLVTYNNPLNLSGSYLDSCGKLLYANNLFGWIDNNEVFQIHAANISANSEDIYIVVGRDDIWYRRLDGSEAPCEVVKAVGTGVYVYPTQFSNDESEQYASIKSIDPSFNLVGLVVAQKTKKIQEWNKEAHILTITTYTDKPIGMAIPKDLQNPYGSKFTLIPAEIKVEKSCYENKLECKLKSKITDFSEVRGSYYSEYLKAHPSLFADIYILSPTKRITETYEYDRKDRLQKITYNTQELAIAVLNGTDEDWTKWLLPPEYLVDSEIKTEEYKEINKGSWEYKTTEMQCTVRVSPDLVSPGPNGETSGMSTNKLDLIYTPTGNDDKRSNSGQLIPPAPERCPTAVRLEEVHLQELAQFADPCPTTLRQRERTYTVDFLAGVTVSPGFNGSAAPPLTVASNQLQAIAKREGRLLWGRYKGQEIAMALTESTFNYSPLMTLRCAEPDGTVQVYLVDGANWVVSNVKALWSCDGIWIGTQLGDTVLRPYTEPQFVGIGMGMGFDFTNRPYALVTTVYVLELGMGIGLQWNTISIVPLNLGLGIECLTYSSDHSQFQLGLGIFIAFQPT